MLEHPTRVVEQTLPTIAVHEIEGIQLILTSKNLPRTCKKPIGPALFEIGQMSSLNIVGRMNASADEPLSGGQIPLLTRQQVGIDQRIDGIPGPTPGAMIVPTRRGAGPSGGASVEQLTSGRQPWSIVMTRSATATASRAAASPVR